MAKGKDADKEAVKKAKAPKEIVVEAKLVYRGKDSKKGTYHPYDIVKESYGIVGTVYFPVTKDVPHKVIFTIPKKYEKDRKALAKAKAADKSYKKDVKEGVEA